MCMFAAHCTADGLLLVASQQVDSGNVRLANCTLVEGNSAPDGGGSSIYLSHDSTLQYTLPAPTGRWLFVRKGLTFHLDPGAEDSDLPYACPAGVVGGPTPEEQSGPQCSRMWCVFPLAGATVAAFLLVSFCTAPPYSCH